MSMYLPIRLRTGSLGISARFSAQSVSITPIAGCSTATTNPRSVQNCRAVFHACSGAAFTTSQRSVPARTRRASGFCGSSSVCLARPPDCWAASPLAVVGALKRSSKRGVSRSGGISSAGAELVDL